MKKLIAIVLATVMMLSMVSFASAEGDYVKLTWVNGNAPAPIDNAQVLEELNKISREKLGVEVEIIYMTSDQVQTAIQSGEVYDMYFTCSWYNNFNNNVSNGYYANIWGKVQEITPDLYATMPENIWNLARSTDGGLYAIPVKKDYAPMNFIVYDAQFAKDAGIEIPEAISSWDEMTDYLVALKAAMEKDPTLGQYPVNIGGAPAGMESSFDFIDRTPLIGVKFGTTEVISVFDDPDVVDRYRTMYKWQQMGLVNPDAPTLTEDSIDSKLHHISFVQAWNDYDYTPSRGFWVEMTKYSGPFVNTDGVQGAMTAFDATLEEQPERLALCLKYQELVNTDKTYRDILAFGVPGVHFNYRDVIEEVKDADGNVTETINHGQVAVRTDLGKSNYSPWRFSQGSYSLNSVEASEDTLNGTYPLPVVDQWDKYFKECETAPESKISGFTFNSAAFNTQYSEISAIKDEYMKDIQCGVVDPDVAIPEMRAKLDAAGLTDIIAEAQRQLDEYLASKVQ